MEITESIPKGTILVCIKNQITGCGIKYCREGSIVKCAAKSKYYQSIAVYRNKREEKNDKWYPVDRKKLRIATDEEAKMYDQGKYSLEKAEKV